MKQFYDVLNETKFEGLVSMMELVDDLPTIYCDMDMVLCDFLKGAKEVLGTDFPKADKRTKWPMISAKKDFWVSLEWMPGAKKMWSFISKYDPHILSAYVEQTTDPNCIPGKSKWARTRLGMSGSKVNLVKRREKQNFAKVGGLPTILIDDYIKNVNQFSARGGIGIHHTSTAKTISELKKLGFK